MTKLTIFIPIDIGTASEVRMILNPLFLLLAEAEVRLMKETARIFGLFPQREAK